MNEKLKQLILIITTLSIGFDFGSYNIVKAVNVNNEEMVQTKEDVKIGTLDNGIAYEEYDDYVVITKGVDVETLIIPSTINDKPVKKIATGAFYNCSNLSNVEISEGIEEISDKAFENCSNLHRVYIPMSIKKASGYSFYSCHYIERLDPKDYPPFNMIYTRFYIYKGSIMENYYSDERLMDRGDVPDNFLYEENESDVKIVKYKADNPEVSIPDEIHCKPVTVIGEEAFKDKSNITNIHLGANVKDIEEGAFDGCTNLTKINIPSEVKEIKYKVFNNCINLKVVNFSGYFEHGVRRAQWVSIGEKAFNECVNLEELNNCHIHITVGDYAFYNCNKLKKLGIRDYIFNVGNYAFYNCVNLEGTDSMDDPNTIACSTGDYAFYNCKKMSKIKCGRKVGEYAFANCESLNEVYINDSVTELGEGAFENCGKIEKLKLTGYVKEIKKNSFKNCTSIKELIIPNSIATIYESAFENCSSLTKLHLPRGLKFLDDNNFTNAEYLTDLEFTEGLEVIGKNCFKNCKNLSSANMIKSLREIGKDSLSNCPNLKFYGPEECYGKKYISRNKIPYKVTSESKSGLLYTEFSKEVSVCGSNETKAGLISIPKRINGKPVKSIEDSAFKSDSNLKRVDIEAGVESINSNAFMDCKNIKVVKIPSSVKEIGKDAFSNCNNLTIYGIKGSLAEEYALNNNINFKEISEKEFSKDIFEYQESTYSAKLTGYTGNKEEVVIPYKENGRNVTVIGGGVFSNKLNIKSIVIPRTITTIGGMCFSNCSNLERIEIPSSVTYIGANALKGCPNVVIFGQKGSYAEKYAKENNIKFVEE